LARANSPQKRASRKTRERVANWNCQNNDVTTVNNTRKTKTNRCRPRDDGQEKPVFGAEQLSSWKCLFTWESGSHGSGSPAIDSRAVEAASAICAFGQVQVWWLCGGFGFLSPVLVWVWANL